MTSWRKKLARWRRSLGAPAAPDARTLIYKSGLFDAAWYLERYPDIAEAGLDPLDHYVAHGGAEGRKAGPFFDTGWYAAKYPDVGQSNLHPMVHFLRHGEGRETVKRVGLKGVKTTPEDFRAVDEILASDLFDAAWYASQNELDVSPQTSALHYLKIGGPAGQPASPYFDSKTYLNVYTDVRDTQTAPLLHYIRHGKAEDRQAFPVSEGAGRHPSVVQRRRQGRPADTQTPGAGQNEPYRRFAPLAQPMPEDGDWIASSDLSSAPGMALVKLGGVSVGLLPEVFEDKTAPLPPSLAASLATFCRLSDVSWSAFLIARNKRQGRTIPEARVEVSGAEDLEILDAWFINDSVVRLRFAALTGGSGAVRVVQVGAGGAGVLVGEGAICDDRMSITDARLLNPFRPFLVVQTDSAGQLKAGLMVAFPSLLRGGAHAAEAAICRDGVDATQKRLRLSEALTREALGWEGAPPIRIGSVTVDLRGATGAERIFSDVTLAWLTGLGVSVSARHADSAAPKIAADHMIRALDKPVADTRSRGSDSILLPCDALPTLATLFRRSPFPTGAGGYLVADAISLRPRWLVTLPESAGTEGAQSDLVPLAFPSIAASSLKGSRSVGVGPLAVRYRSPTAQSEPVLSFPIAPDSQAELLEASGGRFRRGKGIGVVVRVEDTREAANLLESLARQSLAERLHVLVLNSDVIARPVIENMLHRLFPDRHVLQALDKGSPAATLNAAVALLPPSTEKLLLVRQSLILQDVRTLEVLDRLTSRSRAASASCVQVQPSGFQKGAALQYHSGGLFPSSVSFDGSPSAVFATPDVQGALPLSTYPVAGNDLGLFMIPMSVWASLEGLDAERYPFEGFALDLNLRAVKSGLTHFCTSLATATDQRAGTTRARSFHAPLEMLSFDDLAALLKSVTILQALG